MSSENGISQESKYIIWYIMCGITWVMSLVLILCLYRFSLIKKLLIYQKRYPIFVQLECCIALFNCIFIWPVFMQSGSKFETWSNKQHLIDTILFAIYPYCGHAITTLEACRLWTMFFKINHLNALSNNEWKSVIDANSSQTNWYLKNDNKYGNIKWVTIRILVYYIFAVTTSMTIMTQFGFIQWTQFIDCVLYGIPVLFIMYLYWTLLRNKALIHDSFLFYLEFKTTNIVYLVSLTIYLSNQIVFFFNPYIANIVTILLGIFGLSGVSVISALYIPNTILNDDLWNLTHEEFSTSTSTRSHLFIMNILHIDNDTEKQTETKKIRIKLSDVFQNKIYCEYFIQHIIKEFSGECVFSYIEMQQFKHLLHEKYNGNSEIESKQYKSFPDHIPKSNIVYIDSMDEMIDKKEILETFKKIYFELYKKYIDVGSKFEVNISWALRESYQDIEIKYNSNELDIQYEQLLDIFNSVIEEMRFLMESSLQRFINTNEFQMIHRKK
eukprot:379353_1